MLPEHVQDLPDYPEPSLTARIAALQAAATFAAGKCLGGSTDIKTPDVLKVAEAFERWLLAGQAPLEEQR